jgi:hypothetical protein
MEWLLSHPDDGDEEEDDEDEQMSPGYIIIKIRHGQDRKIDTRN